MKYHCVSWCSCRYTNTYTHTQIMGMLHECLRVPLRIIRQYFSPTFCTCIWMYFFIIIIYLFIIFQFIINNNNSDFIAKALWFQRVAQISQCRKALSPETPGKTNTDSRKTRRLLDSSQRSLSSPAGIPQFHDSVRRGYKSPRGLEQCCQHTVLLLPDLQSPQDPRTRGNVKSCLGNR